MSTHGRGPLFVDRPTAVLADERGIESVFAFDTDFRTLGYSLVPADFSET